MSNWLAVVGQVPLPQGEFVSHLSAPKNRRDIGGCPDDAAADKRVGPQQCPETFVGDPPIVGACIRLRMLGYIYSCHASP